MAKELPAYCTLVPRARYRIEHKRRGVFIGKCKLELPNTAFFGSLTLIPDGDESAISLGSIFVRKSDCKFTRLKKKKK